MTLAQKLDNARATARQKLDDLDATKATLAEKIASLESAARVLTDYKREGELAEENQSLKTTVVDQKTTISGLERKVAALESKLAGKSSASASVNTGSVASAEPTRKVTGWERTARAIRFEGRGQQEGGAS